MTTACLEDARQNLSSSAQAVPGKVLEKKRRYLFPCIYHFYKDPPVIVKGEGCELVDHTGKRYLDLYSGVSVMNLGHAHPEVTDVICKQVRTLQHTTTIYLTEQIVDLAEALVKQAPEGLERVFFCASGSEAVEGACLTASLATERERFLALEHGLHGRTKLGMNLTGLEFWRTDPFPSSTVRHVSTPNCYRCPLGLKRETCDLACTDSIKDALQSDVPPPAALVVEPVIGNGGLIPLPHGWLAKVKALLESAGTLLIVDEVQTGFARTGKMFAVEHSGTAPDAMACAKALGGGTPVGAFLAREEVAGAYTRPGASTLGGNPVTAAAGLKVLEILVRDNLAEKAQTLGAYLKDGLEKLQAEFECIGDVRGLGLMVGAELVTDRETKGPDAALCDTVLEAMKDRGFFLGKTGARNVLTFQPPLIITRQQIDAALNALLDVLTENAT